MFIDRLEQISGMLIVLLILLDVFLTAFYARMESHGFGGKAYRMTVGPIAMSSI